jgi:endoglucanase
MRDGVGNTLIELPAKGTSPRLVLVAHLDHPGFTAEEMTGPRTLRARFNGGVAAKYFIGSAVRFYVGDKEVRGRIESVEVDDAQRPLAATLRVPSAIPPGTIGMWDQGGPRVRGHRFSCRVCDDLAGVACALAVLENLYRLRLKASVAVLLTRGEEEGFIGAIAAAKSRKLLKASDRIISIECSAEQTYAKQGDGVILRAGDRTSIFNSAFSRFIHQRAQVLAKIDSSFKAQRALMPGGTCEATVFDAYNYRAAAVCVPMGNYHNMNAATGKIGPEYIDLRDWQSEVTLLTDVAREHHAFTGDHADLRQQLQKRYEKFEKLL